MSNAYSGRGPMPISAARMKGFSLVELMVVVGIIGLLAAIALPAYMDYTAKAKAADVISQFDTLRKKAIIEANAKGVNLCMTVKSSGFYKESEAGSKSGSDPESNPDFVKLLNTIAPANPENQYLTLKRDLSLADTASDDGRALLLSVNAQGDSMNVAIARHFYRSVLAMGMVVPGAVAGDTGIRFSAYLGETACKTEALDTIKKEAMKKLGLVTPAQQVAQAGTTQQPAQPPAQAQDPAQALSQGHSRIVDPRDDPGPKPADDAAKGYTCSGRLCAIMADETPCPMEPVYLVGGQYTQHPDPGSINNRQMTWVAFGRVTIEDSVDGSRAVTKSCATYQQARSLWWDQTSDNNGGCMDIYRDELAPNGQAVTCHYAVPLIPGENERNLQKMDGLFPGQTITDGSVSEKSDVLAQFQ